MEYIKRCREVGKTIGPMAMEEGCREVRAKCMNSADPVENHRGRMEPSVRDFDNTWRGSMSLAAQLEERVLMAACDSALANSCMAAATGAMFNGKDDICKQAFIKGPNPDAKKQCPNLWTVMQTFHKASMKACMTVTPTRGGDFEGSGGEEGGATLG
ncbi:hypothetical protein BSKO_05885 [Bryopsis sp. KO-2023]|nr:hypothetical protein BSKO_05885 [Bryopsis sp. KO-2023]